MKFHVFNDTIKALLLAAAKDDVRYYLNGVCIDIRAGDACAVATNGHILLAVPLALADDAGELVPGQYIIPRDALEGIKPTHKSLPVTIEVLTPAPTPDPERPGVTLRKSPTATVFAGGATAHVQLVDGQYPDWRRVVPLTVSHEPGQYKADYIAAFGKMHKLLGGTESPALAYNGEHGAARVLLPADAVGVIMPMRYPTRPSFDNPAYALRSPGAVAAAA